MNMRLAVRKVIKQIRRGEFGKPAMQVPLVSFDAGFRRRAHAPMCVR